MQAVKVGIFGRTGKSKAKNAGQVDNGHVLCCRSCQGRGRLGRDLGHAVGDVRDVSSMSIPLLCILHPWGQ